MPTETEVTDMLGVPQTASVTADFELQKLNEQELKSAIISAWKKHEELAKKDLAPMLYWLREKLRAQGARNDIADKDRGFGAWVEDNLDISRRTADRWADEYAISEGMKKPSNKTKPTFSHPSKSLAPDGKVTVNVNFVLTEQDQAEFLEAMDILGADAERIIYDAVINAAKRRPVNVNQAHSHSAQA